jgi:hypothetical protein
MSEKIMRPLFVFGLARSGTNLLARLLDAHPAVEIALDPYMPLFKAVRNATIRARATPKLRAAHDPAAPFQDGYQQPHGYKLLELLLDADLDAPIAPGELPELRAAVAVRAALEVPDIAARAGALSGATCRALMESALGQIGAARAQATTQWCGIKEVWVLDFVPALARVFPDARFVAIERDPRAVIASLAALAVRDPSQHAHPISYLRHWRKSVVLARRFAADPTLADRFHLVRYETLVAEPETSTHRVAQFLDLPFEPAMLAPSGSWQGNSSYDNVAGISDVSAARWFSTLGVEAIDAVEFFCAPEMALAGYPRVASANGDLTPGIAHYVAEADGNPGSWRSDSGDPVSEIKFELLRRELLRAPEPVADDDLVRRCFLFEASYRALRAARTNAGRPADRGRKAMP